MRELPGYWACHLVKPTIDDLMRAVIERSLNHGEWIEPSRGRALDLPGASLVLSNPRARLSRSEGRGKAASAIAELCWYLAGSADLDHIAHYLPIYEASAEPDRTLLGAYGPRLFSESGDGQLRRVVKQLRKNRSSRNAVVQILRAEDLASGQRDVPCTIALQFLVREDRLSLVTFMRSNDMFWGLPHDVFAFTMLQELVAADLGLDMGVYVHQVGSLHLYEAKIDEARAFLAEGFQPTDQAMPAMPDGEPWAGVEQLLATERQLRTGSDVVALDLPANPYWADLGNMLAVHTACRAGDEALARGLLARFDSSFYRLFVEDRLDRMRE